MKSTDGLIYLCRCAVNDQAPEKDIIASLDMDELFRLASRHMLAAAVGLTLQSAGVENPDFNRAVMTAYCKATQQEHEQKTVFERLNAAGIWFAPLKGTVIRDFYPQFGMREMADIDVLFDAAEAEKVRDMMISLGYTVKAFGDSVHDSYVKEPAVKFEMHRDLIDISYDRTLYEYYREVESKLLPGEGYERHFGPEDFYLYMLVHEYKHYSMGGTGLRSLLDTFVVLRRFEGLDWDYIARESEKLGIAEFEKKNRTLARELFEPGGQTVSDPDMLDYILGSGAYGTLQNHVKNGIAKHGGGRRGKMKYAFHRIFLPMEDIKKSFPTFYKYKILIPLLPVYRLVRGRKRESLKVEIGLLREK